MVWPAEATRAWPRTSRSSRRLPGQAWSRKRAKTSCVAGGDDGGVGEHGGEVFEPLAEGRDAELDGGDAGEELLTHAAGGDDAAEVGVVGDDEAGFATEAGIEPLQAEEELVLEGRGEGR